MDSTTYLSTRIQLSCGVQLNQDWRIFVIPEVEDNVFYLSLGYISLFYLDFRTNPFTSRYLLLIN